MEILSSRTLLSPIDMDRSVHFYGEVLGLRVFREFGTNGRRTGIVFFLGGGFLELSGKATGNVGGQFRLWLQVPDLAGEHRRLAEAGVKVIGAPRRMPWGLDECWIADPDGNEIALVEVPAEHPLRRRVD